MGERCDRCGHVMTGDDYVAEYATVHVGTNGNHAELGSYHADSWYLLCGGCLKEFRAVFGEWLGDKR